MLPRLVALLAVVGVLTACSGGDAGDAGAPGLPAVDVVAPTVVVDAIRALQEEGSAAFEFAHINESQVGRTSITGEGVTTFDGRSAESEFTLTLLGQENVGVARTVEGVRYVMSGGTGRWQQSARRGEPGLTDAAGRLEAELGRDVELAEAGREDAAGVPTTKWTWTAEDTTDDETGAETSQVGGSYWIDDEGRLRQLDSRRIVEQGGVTRIVADILTFRDLGVAVSVEAPPEDLVDPPTQQSEGAVL